MGLDPRRTIPWRDFAVAARDVAYGKDGETIAIVCEDGAAWFYSFPTNLWVYAHDHATDILSGRFTPDGAHFASTDRSGVLVVRDVIRTFARRNE